MKNMRKFYINGRWIDPVESCDFEVINPATEEAVATISLGSSADIDKAVAAARNAFDDWGQTAVEERAVLLDKLIAIYKRRSKEMAMIMTQEMGTPITLSLNDQASAGDGHLQSTVDALRAHQFEHSSPRGGSVVRNEPIGVCALITPWNWPINQVVVKVAPALAAGCTVVLKPSEYSPLSAILFAEMVDEVGFPTGVFNLVNGDGTGAGSAMTGHRDVDMVSFTGSTRAGITISKVAADSVKRVSLELGGKSPNLLFADADLEAAVNFSVSSVFSNSGQSCDAPTRLIVEHSVYDQVVDLAVKAAETTNVGDPMKEGDHIGPVVNKKQFNTIQAMIQMGIDEGARLVIGGTGRPQGLNKGYYVRPTIFIDVNNDMAIAREEIFGPVLTIIPFDDEADAIRIANDTPYGLAAYIQSGNQERTQRVARKIRAGNVSINGADVDYDVPFGGYKQSGNGRENGAYGLHEYLEIKTITG